MTDITVSLADLLLVLYLPKPTVNYESQTCNACGRACGAHYCQPKEQAYDRLVKQASGVLYGLPDGVSP